MTSSAEDSGTTKQMLCSLLLWLIASTLAPTFATGKVRRDAGHAHHAAAETVIRFMLRMAVIALTVPLPSRLSLRATISGTGCAGSKVLSTRTGIFFSMAGVTVLGWSTLAP